MFTPQAVLDLCTRVRCLLPS